ncbi:UNVERIFIED_CONTAM: hypothetical protein Sindi_1690100 [Sesamum indicum]
MAELPLRSVSAIEDSKKTAKATTTMGSSTVDRVDSGLTELTRSTHPVNPVQQAATRHSMLHLLRRTFAEVVALSQASKTAPTTSHKFFLADSTPPSVGAVFTDEKGPRLVFTDMETEALAALFRLALVGKFSHEKPQYRHLHRLIAGLGVKGAFTVNMINAKHVLICLSNESNFSYLWLRRIWHIQGFPMRIFKWTPTFTPAQESSTIPIWVCFPELPSHLSHKDALFADGTPLQIDDCTLNQSKLSKARIDIEIDLTKPLVEGFDLQINGVTSHQKVVYEQLPKYCNLCKHVGHDNLECYTMGNAPRPPPRAKQSKGKETMETEEQVVTETAKAFERGKHGNDIGEIETSGVNCDLKVENDVHIDNANCIAHDDNMPTMVRENRIPNNIVDENVVFVDVVDTTIDNDKMGEDNLEYKVADGNWTHVKNAIMLFGQNSKEDQNLENSQEDRNSENSEEDQNTENSEEDQSSKEGEIMDSNARHLKIRDLICLTNCNPVDIEFAEQLLQELATPTRLPRNQFPMNEQPDYLLKNSEEKNRVMKQMSNSCGPRIRKRQIKRRWQQKLKT